MKKNIIGKIIIIVSVVAATIEIGITIGCYMLSNIDYNKNNIDYNIEIVR